MVSRIVGPELGVSKKAALTIVRIPQAIPNRDEIRAENLVGNSFGAQRWRSDTVEHALALIVSDVKRRGVPQKTVLSMSIAIDEDLTTIPSMGMELYEDYRALKELADLGVTILIAAGNDAGYPDDQVMTCDLSCGEL